MRSLVSILLVLMMHNVAAQVHLPVARNIQQAFDKGTRSSSGQPGSRYWQNTAVYDLDIRFDPVTRLISGTANIAYKNQSPDTLSKIVFKLFTDLYKGGAMRAYPIEEQDISKGMAIHTMAINGAEQNLAPIQKLGTNMIVPVDPVLPGQSIRFSIHYSYVLNKGSHIRTGEVAEGAYFVAYSFPRITVYDDVDGWNMAEYLGTYEFYNDFCDFNVSVTVPQHYGVWATGDLVNCEEVYAPVVCERLRKAETADEVVLVIDQDNLKKKDYTAGKAVNTFRFEAKNVTDFAFATSNHYIWRSSSLVVDSAMGRRTRVDAVHNPVHTDFDEVIFEAKKTVELMSFVFPKWTFPYNHETIFEGLDKMEYPMMVNDVPIGDKVGSFSLTCHEVFHTMFPFYMGTNETKYGWMDEGWATLGEWMLTPMYVPGEIDSFAMAAYESAAGKEVDLPVMTLSTQLQGIYYENESAFSLNSYPKPALGYWYVKDLLGDEVFFKALHHYIRTWNGKHPLPQDFFNSFNKGAGRNLDWFWKIWFYDTGYPDLAIGDVKPGKITIVSKGNKPTPVDITVHFADNTTEKIHRTIGVWEKGNRSVVIPLSASKKILKVELGSFYNADIDRSDNVWIGK